MRLTSIILLMLIFGSCSQNDDGFVLPERSIVGEWRLFSSTSAWDNMQVIGSDLPWQEWYVFESDSTFVKSRDHSGRVNEVSGTYTIEESENEAGQIIRLSYGQPEDIISSCTAEEEVFRLKYGCLVNGSWAPCDGPILEYVPLN